MNGILGRCLRGAAVLGLALVAASAGAQKPALVQDRDEPGRSPYSQTLAILIFGGDCQTKSCDIRFDMVPVGKRLVVTHASGQLISDTAGNGNPYVISTMMTYTSIVGSPRLYLPVAQPYGPLSSTAMGYMVSSPVMQFYEAGTAPVMRGETNGEFIAVIYTLVGYYVTVP